MPCTKWKKIWRTVRIFRDYYVLTNSNIKLILAFLSMENDCTYNHFMCFFIKLLIMKNKNKNVLQIKSHVENIIDIWIIFYLHTYMISCEKQNWECTIYTCLWCSYCVYMINVCIYIWCYTSYKYVNTETYVRVHNRHAPHMYILSLWQIFLPSLKIIEIII